MSNIQKDRLYPQYHSMKNRCTNPHCKDYHNYGGRGIKICDEWATTSKNYIKWAYANGWKPGLQLDRIDVNGDYCPENCRFVTPTENGQNRRNNIYLTVNGKTKAVSYWAYKLGVDRHTIYFWYHKYGKRYAEKRIETMSLPKYKRPVLCIENGKVYESISDAARDLFGNEKYGSSITAVCRCKKHQCKGKHFRYADDQIVRASEKCA